jgi:hypothetical protein
MPVNIGIPYFFAAVVHPEPAVSPRDNCGVTNFVGATFCQ